MAGFNPNIPFYTGEGIVSADFSNAHGLIRRLVNDELAFTLLGAQGEGEVALRPLRRALCCRANGVDLDLLFDAGLVLQRSVSADNGLSDAAVEPENLMGWTDDLGVTIGTAHATLWRRDIVQARIVSTDEATVSRHFEDGVTRVKTSAVVVKRTNTVVEVAVKAGATQASAALADTVAAEAAADSGWFKIASVRVDPTATAISQDTVWDWRKPAGYGGSRIMAQDWAFDQNGGAGWQMVAFGRLFAALAVSESAVSYPFNNAGPLTRSDDGWGRWEDHRRLGSMLFHYSLATNAFTFLQLMRSFNRSVATSLVLVQDVIARVAAPAGAGTYAEAILYTADDYPGSSYTDPPIWANGHPSPATNGNGFTPGLPGDQLCLRVGSPAAGNPVDHVVSGVFSHFWGDF